MPRPHKPAAGPPPHLHARPRQAHPLTCTRVRGRPSSSASATAVARTRATCHQSCDPSWHSSAERTNASAAARTAARSRAGADEAPTAPALRGMAAACWSSCPSSRHAPHWSSPAGRIKPPPAPAAAAMCVAWCAVPSGAGTSRMAARRSHKADAAAPRDLPRSATAKGHTKRRCHGCCPRRVPPVINSRHTDHSAPKSVAAVCGPSTRPNARVVDGGGSVHWFCTDLCEAEAPGALDRRDTPVP
eukprot:351672-Chlamydomonas_euryale.AAC.3